VDAATGAIAQRIDGGPFGQVLQDTSPGFQPFGFAGCLYEPKTGLVRFGHRDYDPSIGRWTTRDPVLFASGQRDLVKTGGKYGIDATIKGKACVAF